MRLTLERSRQGAFPVGSQPASQVLPPEWFDMFPEPRPPMAILRLSRNHVGDFRGCHWVKHRKASNASRMVD